MKNYLYQKFPKQLTRWMKKEQLVSCIDPFNQYGQIENKHFLIKSNGKKIKPKFAIFIPIENKLRREEDKILIKKLSIVDLILLTLPQKREGISILKSLYTHL